MSTSGGDERWLPVPEWDGLYKVSDHGRIRSIARPGNRGPNTGRILRGSLKNGRHIAVVLSDSRNGRREQRYVHQLVANAFVPNPHGYPIVRHLDDDATNNSVSNLAWGTQGDNAWDKVRNGRHHSAGITHCKRGHEYTPENTGINSVHKTRYCRTCNKVWQANARKRALEKKRGTL